MGRSLSVGRSVTPNGDPDGLPDYGKLSAKPLFGIIRSDETIGAAVGHRRH